MTGLRLILAVLLLAMGLPYARASALRSPEAGSVSALFIHTDTRNDEALKALAATLQARYGMPASRLTRLNDTDAKGERIGAVVFEAIRAIQAMDTLIVIVSLELHEEGRVLKTADFDPERPWTGLPTETLRKLATVTRKGTLILVMPDCPRAAVAAAVQRDMLTTRGSEGESARAIISYCAKDTAQSNEFLNLLRTTLEAMARAPTTRAPWQGADELGLVSVTGIAERLTKASRTVPAAADYGSSGGGWLRVFAIKESPPQFATILDELRGAAKVDSARPVLRSIVQGAGNPNAAAELPALLLDLSEFALDKHRDVALRTLTVQALGDLPGTTAQAALQEVFRRTDETPIKIAALKKVQVVPGSHDLGVLLVALDDPDPGVQLSAVQAIGATQDPQLVEHLHRLLKVSPDASVRAAAARAAGSVPIGTAAPEVLKFAVNDASAEVRVEAVSALGRAKAAADVGTLLTTALDDPDTRVRESAAFAVGQHVAAMGVTAAVQLNDRLLTLARSDASQEVRAGALWSLTKSNSPELASELAPLLQDDNSPELRMAAVEALARLANPASALVLLPVAQNEKADLRLRVAATRALGKLNSPFAAEALLDLSASKNLDIETAATSALQTSRASAPKALDLVKAKETPRAQRLNAIAQLGSSTDPLAAQQLLKLLSDEDSELRERAALALRTHADSSTVTSLDGIVADSGRDLATRLAAVQALSGRRSDDINARLTAHLRGNLEKLPAELAAALSRAVAWELPAKRPAMETLLRVTTSSSPLVRVAATDALRLVNNRVTLGKLATMSRDDSDGAVRDAAAEALRNAPSSTSTDNDTRVENQIDLAAGAAGKRSWRIDVFWCEGDTRRQETAKRLIADLVAFAPSLRERGEAITRIRLRLLSEDTNYIPGYRVVQNEIRYENTDANERYVAGLLRERLGSAFALRAVRSPTPTYMSVFVCDLAGSP